MGFSEMGANREIMRNYCSFFLGIPSRNSTQALKHDHFPWLCKITTGYPQPLESNSISHSLIFSDLNIRLCCLHVNTHCASFKYLGCSVVSTLTPHHVCLVHTTLLLSTYTCLLAKTTLLLAKCPSLLFDSLCLVTCRQIIHSMI